MIPLLIFIAALIIIGFIAFLFVYNFRTKHQPPSIPPVPEFNDDFSREFNLGRRNILPRAIAPSMPPRKQNTAGVRGIYVNKNGIMVYEPVTDSMQNGYNIESTFFDDGWPTVGTSDNSISENDTTEFGGGDFGGGGAGSSYDDSGSSGSSDYSSDSGSSDGGGSYD